jgi:hypothetical protein
MTVTARAEHTPRHPSVPRKVTVPGLGIDRGDDPVRRDAPGDAEHPVVVFVDVLAGHYGQQLRRRLGRSVQALAVDGDERGAAIADQRVHQHLPGPGIVPIARRFPRRCIIVVA